jgi:SAM-dependent methyltransferase
MKNSLYDNYDELVVRCLPEYNFLLEIVARTVCRVGSIVDLGCGTGNLARLIFQTIPTVKVKGIDASVKFLAIADNKNAGYNFYPILEDVLNFNPGRSVQDCIVSSFAIHHFEDDEKIKLFRKIFRSLKPGGVFVNLDMVEPEKNYQEAIENFLAQMKENGLSAEFIEAERKEMVERDRPVRLSTQKKWLEEIGFEFEVLCDIGLFAVYVCQKPFNKRRKI